MRIAIPIDGGRLAPHFGHCSEFALLDVDPAARRITSTVAVPAPEHQPGRLPPWLKERGVTLVIAGGLGTKARARFAEAAIEVLTGAPQEDAESLVRQYLDGTLVTGPNGCHHGSE
jgi:predicted Fe-Mo cluster-binding NifX family protein